MTTNAEPSTTQRGHYSVDRKHISSVRILSSTQVERLYRNVSTCRIYFSVLHTTSIQSDQKQRVKIIQTKTKNKEEKKIENCKEINL